MIEKWQEPEYRTKQLRLPQFQKGRDNSNWTDGGYPLYVEYEDKINWILETRKNLENEFIQITCTNCNSWFTPDKIDLDSFVKTANGIPVSRKAKYSLYCSKPCYYDCMNKRTNVTKKWKANIQELKNAKRRRESENREELKRKEIEDRRREKKEKREREAEEKLHKLKERKRITKYNTKNKKEIDKKHNKERWLKLKEHPLDYKTHKLYHYSKSRSKEKSIDHTITKQWVTDKVTAGRCEVTGMKFDLDPNYDRNPFGPSIDRTNNLKGYTPENCKMVIWAYNSAKCKYTDEELYTCLKAFLNKTT